MDCFRYKGGVVTACMQGEGQMERSRWLTGRECIRSPGAHVPAALPPELCGAMPRRRAVRHAVRPHATRPGCFHGASRNKTVELPKQNGSAARRAADPLSKQDRFNNRRAAMQAASGGGSGSVCPVQIAALTACWTGARYASFPHRRSAAHGNRDEQWRSALPRAPMWKDP